MSSQLRKTGIDIVGEVPWGTHFCHFYETKQDLLDSLIPFFSTGLESSEFCLWVVSNPELLPVTEAKAALAQAVPDLDRHLADGNIEILDGLDWYLEKDVFDFERVTRAWDATLQRALARGHAGLRVSGDTFWLGKKDWKDFSVYEKQLNDFIRDRPMTALCTYPLAKSGAAEVLDVVQAHQVAIARRQGKWEVIETPELIQANAEIKRLNEALEQRVVERTRELAAANEELRREIDERKQAEDALRRSEDRLRLVIDTVPALIHTGLPDGQLDFFNQRWLTYVGLSLEDLSGWKWTAVIHPDDVAAMVERWRAALATGEPYEHEARVRRADGEYRWMVHREVPLRDEQGNIVKWYASSIDIEDRKRAEDGLRQSEDHLRLVIDTIPVMAWTLRPDGIADFLNQRWMDYAGLSLEQYVQDPSGPVHPEDLPRVVEKWRRNMAAGEANEDEMRLRRADGEYRWFLVRNAPLRDEQGDVVKWYGVSIDIEERKRAEAALDERLRFGTLVTELSAAFANLSTNEVDREIDKWLQTLAEFLGVDRASFFQFEDDWTTLYRSHSYTAPGIKPLPPPPIGMTEQFPWITDQFRRGVTVKWSRIPDDMPAEAVKEKEYAASLGAKSGLNIPVLVGGSVICAIAFTSIVTYRDWPDAMVARLRLVGEIFAAAIERKHAEALLHAKEQEYRAIVENAPDHIIRYDRNFRRVYVNPAVARDYGLPVEAVIGKPIGSVIQDAGLVVAEDALERVRQAIADVFETGKSYAYELAWPMPAGVTYFSVRLFPEVDPNGSVINVLGISRDITEHKQAEEKLKATSEQLRALSARLQSAREEEGTRIAREIHDELGSTLTTLRWDLEGFEKTLSVLDNLPQVASLQERIKSMTGLIDTTIKSVRRISSELRPTALDDLGLLAAVEWQARQFEERTGIVCQCYFAAEKFDLTEAQATALFRVFQEALTNVLRHAQATMVETAIAKEVGQIVLTISDNGRGITEDETLGPQSLGLLGMRERAYLIGGEIDIVGIKGKGTTITVRVPLSDELP
jgi:PAS domain S-box-containing protein